MRLFGPVISFVTDPKCGNGVYFTVLKRHQVCGSLGPALCRSRVKVLMRCKGESGVSGGWGQRMRQGQAGSMSQPFVVVDEVDSL